MRGRVKARKEQHTTEKTTNTEQGAQLIVEYEFVFISLGLNDLAVLFLPLI